MRSSGQLDADRTGDRGALDEIGKATVEEIALVRFGVEDERPSCLVCLRDACAHLADE